MCGVGETEAVYLATQIVDRRQADGHARSTEHRRIPCPSERVRCRQDTEKEREPGGEQAAESGKSGDSRSSRVCLCVSVCVCLQTHLVVVSVFAVSFVSLLWKFRLLAQHADGLRPEAGHGRIEGGARSRLEFRLVKSRADTATFDTWTTRLLSVLSVFFFFSLMSIIHGSFMPRHET